MMHHLKKYYLLVLFCVYAYADPVSDTEIAIRSPLGKLNLIAAYVQKGEPVQTGQIIARLESKSLRETLVIVANKRNNLKKALNKVDHRLAQYTADLNQKKVDQANLGSQYAYSQQPAQDQAQATQLKLALEANRPHLKNLENMVADTRALKDRVNHHLIDTELKLIQLEEEIKATEIKAPHNGIITAIASAHTQIPAAGYLIATIKRT